MDKFLLKNIPGQRQALANFIRMNQTGKLPHAMILIGPEGSGDPYMPLAMAAYLMCQNNEHGDACGVCANCKKTAAFSHPDLIQVFPVTTTKEVKSKPTADQFLHKWKEFVAAYPFAGLTKWLEFIGSENKQGNISVEESQRVVKALQLKSYEGGKRVIFIWHADRMNIAAANKLLKVLEEPPENTYFILTTHHAEDILPTILSRLQIIRLKPFDHDEVMAFLKTQYDIQNEQALKELVNMAEGNLAQLVEWINNDTGRESYFEKMRSFLLDAYYLKFHEMSTFADEMSKWPKEKQKNFMLYIMSVFRKILRHQFDSGIFMVSNDTEKNFIEKLSQQIDRQLWLEMLDRMDLYYMWLERNVNAKMIWMDFGIRFIALMRTKKLTFA